MQIVDCGNELIQTKDKLHGQFFDLQLEPKTIKRDFSTLIDKTATDDLIVKIEAAFNRAKECNVDEKLRQVGLDYLASAKKRKLGWDKERTGGILYYSAPPTSASEFVDTDLNYAINIIHNLGASLLKSSGDYAGCSIIGDLNSVNRGSLAFCEGIPLHYGNHQGKLMDGGEKIEEELGCHRAVSYITEGQGGYDLDLELTVPGAVAYRERLDGVKEVMETDFGQECAIAGHSMKCKGPVTNIENFRKIAYFLDSIADVDLLLKKCVPVAINHARTKAKEAADELKELTYTRLPKPSSSGGWAHDVCPDIYANWEVDKKKEIEESLQADIDEFAKRAYARLDEAKDRRECDIKKYELVRMGESLATTARWNCEDLAKRTGKDRDACRKIVTDWKEKARSISQGIIESCPPASLIDEIEKKTDAEVPFDTTSDYVAISMVCDLAGDDRCKTALAKANDRHEIRTSLHLTNEFEEVAYNNLNKAIDPEFYAGPCHSDRFYYVRAGNSYMDSALTHCHAAASKQAIVSGERVNFRQCNELTDKWQKKAGEVSRELVGKCNMAEKITAAEENTAVWYDFDHTDDYETLSLVCRLAGDQSCLDNLQAAIQKHQAREP